MDKTGELFRTVPVLRGEFAKYPGIDPTLTKAGAAADARVTGDKLAEHEKRLILQERIIDKTLTKEGAAADAKVVGDKFAEVDRRIADAAEDAASVPGRVQALEKTTAEHTEQLDAQEKELDAQAKVQQSQAQTMTEIKQTQQGQGQDIAAHGQSIQANAAAIAAQEKTLTEHGQQLDKAVTVEKLNQAIAQAIPFAKDSGAVHYTPDEKSEEEKEIARGNIGAAAAEHTHTGYAEVNHGNHVPATETANNARFLRNDNTWQNVTPENIGMKSEALTITYEDGTTGTLEVFKK